VGFARLPCEESNFFIDKTALNGVGLCRLRAAGHHRRIGTACSSPVIDLFFARETAGKTGKLRLIEWVPLFLTCKNRWNRRCKALSAAWPTND
jgi:hypothetical protein